MAPLPAISQKRLLPSGVYLGRSFDEPKGGEGWTQRSAKDVSIERRPGRRQLPESRWARARCGSAVFRVSAANPAVGVPSAYFGVAMVGWRTLGQIRGRGSNHSSILHLDPETAIDHG